MKKFVVGLFFFAVASVAIAAPEFVPYEGEAPIQIGAGGAKEMYEGIEVWVSGTPQREFEVLGYLTDRRHKTGILGAIRMSGLEKALAKATKEAGGDALVKLSEYSETVGFVGSGNTQGNASVTGNSNYATARGSSYSSTASSAVQKNNTSFAVIRYVELKELTSLDDRQIANSRERCLAFPVAMTDQGAFVPATRTVNDRLGMIWISGDGEFFWETPNAQGGESRITSGQWSETTEGFSATRVFQLDGKSYRLSTGSNLLIDEASSASPIAWLECLATES